MMRNLTEGEVSNVAGSGLISSGINVLIAVIGFAYEVGKDLAEQDNAAGGTCKGHPQAAG